MTSTPPIPYTLQRLTLTDLTSLFAIFSEAFATDRHTQVKLLGKDYSSASSDIMAEPLSSWLQNDSGRYTVLKAVDNYTSTILGWACWPIRGHTEKPPTALSSAHRGHPNLEHKAGREEEHLIAGEDGHQQSQQSFFGMEIEEADSSRQRHEASSKTEKNGDKKEKDQAHNVKHRDKIQLLESITNHDMQRWQKILMPDEDTKCMIMIAIAVSPPHQSRGVGSALIRWGTEKADAADVFCWVHASEAGHRTFAMHGFQELGSLVVDLDEYAARPPEGKDGGDGRWGPYTFI